MKLRDFSVLFLVLFGLLPCGNTQGFFSSLFNRDSNNNSENDVREQSDCRLTKMMPRIALAVIGGTPLRSENSAPYIAALGERQRNGSVEWFCGGSILSSNAILTAAHCLTTRNVDTVRVGSFIINHRPSENDYNISETSIHPRYSPPVSYNDIAVIKLSEPIKFSRKIRPVCLSSDNNDKHNGQKARVIGWGAEEVGGDGSHELQQVEVEIFSRDDCDKAYLNSSITPKTFPRGIREEQLCAGSSEGGKDACQGDSGGPLVLSDPEGVIRQVGIVSTGAGCGLKLYPGVYIRVSSYYDWIQKQIENFKPTNIAQDNSKRIRI